MHPSFAERYSLLLVDFLSYGGPLLRELRVQVEALGRKAKSEGNKKPIDKRGRCNKKVRAQKKAS